MPTDAKQQNASHALQSAERAPPVQYAQPAKGVTEVESAEVHSDTLMSTCEYFLLKTDGEE